MNQSLFLGSTLGLLLLAGTASAEIVKYRATLNGQQEVPPVTTTASGSAEFEFDTETKILSGTITFEGLTPTAGHIHEAACGENGPVRFNLESLTSPIQIEDVTLEADEEAALAAGKYYINIHSEAHAGGEIRGQIYKEGSDEKCPEDKGVGAGDGGGGGGGGGGDGGGTGGGKNDAGASSSGGAAPASTDDGGCSTTGSAPGSGLAIALGVGLAVATMKRRRKH
jgi:MYXO-CTERM domain-containing protein